MFEFQCKKDGGRHKLFVFHTKETWRQYDERLMSSVVFDVYGLCDTIYIDTVLVDQWWHVTLCCECEPVSVTSSADSHSLMDLHNAFLNAAESFAVGHKMRHVDYCQ